MAKEFDEASRLFIEKYRNPEWMIVPMARAMAMAAEETHDAECQDCREEVAFRKSHVRSLSKRVAKRLVERLKAED